MFLPDIKKNFPFLINYFSKLIAKNEGFPQSIIFYGDNIFAQYLLTLNLAKIMNCTNDKNLSCNCTNCSWIKKNTHPAITTVSKIDFKPENDKSKTVISVTQTLEIKKSLSTTSEYHRFFIICDAEEKELSAKNISDIKIFQEPFFSLINEEKPITSLQIGDKSWFPKGINSKIFQEESANSLLKSLEEPPDRTTFIFLTQDKKDLIETIISRSQCFYVPSQQSVYTDFSSLKSIFTDYPQINRLEINNIAKNLLKYGEENKLSPEELTIQIQEFLKFLAVKNSENKSFVEKILKDIKFFDKVFLELKSYIKPLLAFENAIFEIYSNWNNIE